VNIKPQQIILFDGVCNFCNYWVNFIIDRDNENEFKFAALQSEAGKKTLNKFNLDMEDFDTFILVEGENYFTKSTAALKIAQKLSCPVKILYLLIFIPKFLRDFIYSLVAKNRYKFFGKRDVCRIPTEDEKKRFLI
jgi:predicted DCC family thiol-disulfide oxidoreductase YuxK